MHYTSDLCNAGRGESLLHDGRLQEVLGHDVLPIMRLLHAHMAAACAHLAKLLRAHRGHQKVKSPPAARAWFCVAQAVNCGGWLLCKHNEERQCVFVTTSAVQLEECSCPFALHLVTFPFRDQCLCVS